MRTQPTRRLLFIVIPSVLAAVDPAAAREQPFTGRRVAEFRAAGPPSLHMPTDVAVSPDGSVFVADGVNDRVLQFEADGRLRAEIRTVGAEALARPIGVAVDAAGALWIADTGTRRVVVMSSKGRLQQVIPVAPAGGPGERAVSLTDVAPTTDGKSAWLVDNAHHRLLRVDLATGVQSTVGRKGESLGQLNHPFMICVGRDDGPLVTDVINGRVSRFTAAADPGRAIASYGVDLGQLYRPKGVACDADGHVWVADSVLGAIQVFDAEGRLLDALRDEAGKVLKLVTPTGIALDSEGRLYVVELSADRVAQLAITRGPVPKEPSQPKRPTEITGAQGRGCTLCHLEWMEPLSRHQPTQLIDPPANPRDDPAVARAETCLSCHDGSTTDSRRRVWQEHGHRTGVKPRPEMRVPVALPLVDGKIACRTCHSAHVSGQFNADINTAVFLRVQNFAGELCIGCHADKTRGPELGTHPTGGMPWPVPQALIDAGAKVGPNPRELTCVVCHTPHGAAHDHLLVMGTSSNELCVTCHDQIRPGMFRGGGNAEHPLSPVVNAEQAAVIHRLGAKLGPGDHLICLSCHKLHHGKGERFMLASDLDEGRFCIGCHSNKTTVIGTSHDLRTNHPDERNRLGMTPQSGGPCSACHMFHRYARAPESSTLDPGGGKCITCHQQGRCAASRTLGDANHPKAACVECHDPHQARLGRYLRAPVGELCIRCHGPYAAIDGGPHDIRSKSSSWPAAALAENDRCMACHRPHGDAATGLYRVPPAASAAQQDGACLACHPSSDWHAPGALAALHPPASANAETQPDAPFVTQHDGSKAVGCRSCHNPHVPDGRAAKFLRPGEDGTSATTCVTCHASMSAIAITGHGPESMTAAGLDAASCRPCHAAHGPAGSVGPRMLSSTIAEKGTAAPHVAVSSVRDACVACHRPGGPAPTPPVAHHPDVPMFITLAEGDLESLPLFDERGRIDPRGAITCATCHAPHGRLPDRGADADLTADAPPARSLDQLAAMPRETRRAMRLLLRPFAAPNVCIHCHGADALRRFLYFHDPQRRGGSLGESAAPPVIRRSRL